MKLNDLREELTARATESDDHTPDLLAGVHRKISRTKRRRVAGIVGGVAAVAAFALGVLPGLTSTTTPDPAEPPADYTKDGITLHGVEGPDRLEKGWIGGRGESVLNFAWTPTTNNITLRTFCKSTLKQPRAFRVTINDRQVVEGDCTDRSEEHFRTTTLSPDNPAWVDVPLGAPARVAMYLVDDQLRPVTDGSVQLAVGIYTSPLQTADSEGVPMRMAPAAPGDYSKAGIRFRANVAGDTLAAAAVGDPGQSTLRLKFTATTGTALSLRDFCTANGARYDLDDPEPYELRIRVNNGVEHGFTCFSGSTDVAVQGGGTIIPDATPVGETVEVTARLTNKKGETVSVEGARIALGVYVEAGQRLVDGITVDETVESLGYPYKLAEVKTVDATTTKQLTLAIPADKPFVISYGSSELGAGGGQIRGTLAGLEREALLSTTPGVSDDFGIDTQAQPAGMPRTVTLKITDGKPTTGRLILALYQLED